MKSSNQNTISKKHPKLEEERGAVGKPKDTIVEELTHKSFAEEIEQDKNKVAVLIGRGQQAEEKLAKKDSKVLGVEEKTLNHEVASAAIFKRALILVGSGDLQVEGGSDKPKAAKANNLPVSSYLTHGSRVVIEIPAGSGDKLMNWITTGDPEQGGLSRKQDQQEAIAEGKYVYNRSAATHDTEIITGDDGTPKVKELKGLALGTRDFVSNKLLGKETKHFGIDLALDAELGGRDAEGNIVEAPDGEHGHLYFHYVPPTATSPGSLMIGCEGAAPASSKHSKLGASDVISATGGSKFEDLAVKQKLSTEKEYESTVVPKKYNGMYVPLDEKKLDALVKIDDKAIGPEIASALPASSPEEFSKNLQEGKTHERVEFKGTKKETIKPEKLDLYKTVLNKITFGKAFSKEIKEYKEASKLYKNSAAISQKDEERKKISGEKLPNSTKKNQADIKSVSVPSLKPDPTLPQKKEDLKTTISK